MTTHIPLETLTAELKTLYFPAFTADTAWMLGLHLRRIALAHPSTSPIAIRIIHANGHILFSTYTRPGTIADSETWIARKAATVFRWGTSTLEFGEKMRRKGKSGDRVSEAAVVDDNAYACHGGGFPIRVTGVEGVVAAAVISGLPQWEDHEIVVAGVRACIDELKAVN
ncbi:hypothetical protein B0H34DRAFT_669737 [Crassisporium funariophilum]|nr:hypothetical protein B0H34DRAFT_669737 [Crassisporium funariophilum]